LELSSIYKYNAAWGVAYMTGKDNELELCEVVKPTKKQAISWAKEHAFEYLGEKLFIIELVLTDGLSGSMTVCGGRCAKN
jgi:hypothetical protein